MKIVSVRPGSEDVVAVVSSADDVLEFYDIVGKGALSKRVQTKTTPTKGVKQFVWEESEEMSYLVVTRDGSLIRNETEEVVKSGVECAACHQRRALAYATTDGSVFVGETIVMFKT